MSSHAPIEEEQRLFMNAVAESLDNLFNPALPGLPKAKPSDKQIAFVLLTAKFGEVENGRVNYISNGDREDMVAMLKELLARFEGQPETAGRA